MNRFAVNLSTIFTEFPFLERFKKARECGFSFVECQFPYDFSIEEIRRELKHNQLSMVLLNLPSGAWEKGERGLAAISDRKEEFKQSVQTGIEYAKALHVSKVHCMAGIVSEVERGAAEKVYLENLSYAGAEMAKHDLTLLIEPINQCDMPGYFLHNLHQAKEILAKVNLSNVRLQFDFYHIERIHGNSLKLYKQFASDVGHVQIADVPGRHEPGTGTVDYQTIYQYLSNSYSGYVGLEYIPLEKSADSFAWLKKKGVM